MTGTNGHDRGPVGFPFRVDHAAEDARHRKLAMGCLVVLGAGLILAAVCCGAGLAFWRL